MVSISFKLIRHVFLHEIAFKSPIVLKTRKHRSKKSDPRKSPVAVKIGMEVLSGSIPCFHMVLTK